MQCHRNEITDKNKFNIGDIVYFVSDITHKWDWGVLSEYYSDGYALELYEIVDGRTIDGIPIKEYQFNHSRRKLPKGWTYNTQVITIGEDEKLSELKKRELYTGEPDNLRHLIDIGLFVRPCEQLHGHIDVDIDKDGWTTKLSYRYGDEYRPNYCIVPESKCYRTLSEAHEVVNAYKKELERQASLSDYDWSVEQIDKTFDKLTWMSDEYKTKARQFLLEQKNVEAIVTRPSTNGIEWKYNANKKWVTVVV